MIALSYLYVPADKPELYPKANASGAHCAILDLEDAVASPNKAAARRQVVALAGDIASAKASNAMSTIVRLCELEPDLDAVIEANERNAGIDGVIVPKATIERIDAVARHLAPHQSVGITALIESGQGLLQAASLAHHPRVNRMALGEADLVADLGVTVSPGAPELLHARSSLVVACAAAQIDAPTAGVATDLSNSDALNDSCTQLANLGFGSRSAIHPKQVAVINAAFAPTAAELAAARHRIAAFDRLLADGQGASTDADGNFVDEAVIRRDRLLIERFG